MVLNWDEEYLHECGDLPPVPPKDYNLAGRESSEDTYYEPFGQSPSDRYQDNRRNHNSKTRNDKNYGAKQKPMSKSKVSDGSMLRNLPLCKKCTRPVYDETDGYEVEVLNGWFHPDCFTCSHCDCTFDDHNPFVPHNGNAYCEKHYEQLFLPNCDAWYLLLIANLQLLMVKYQLHSENHSMLTI